MLAAFNESYKTLLPVTYHENEPEPTQLATKIKRDKDLIYPKTKKEFFVKQVMRHWKDENSKSQQTKFSYNKKLAEKFKETSTKDIYNSLFIQQSLFG